jgi:hypothetical protein
MVLKQFLLKDDIDKFDEKKKFKSKKDHFHE